MAVLTAGDMTVTDLLQVRTYAEEAYLQYGLWATARGGGGGRRCRRWSCSAVLSLLAARALLAADPARLGLGRGRAKGLAARAVAGPGRGDGRWWSSATVVALPLYSLVWRAGRVGGSAARAGSAAELVGGGAGRDAPVRLGRGVRSAPADSAAVAAAGATAAVVLAWALAWSARRPGLWRGVAAGAGPRAGPPGPVAGMALVFAYRWIPPFMTRR